MRLTVLSVNLGTALPNRSMALTEVEKSSSSDAESRTGSANAGDEAMEENGQNRVCLAT